MMYQVKHITTYTYTDTVSICHNELRLTPRESTRQNALSCRLTVRPHPAVMHQATDFFGNTVTFLAIQEPHRALTITAHSAVEVMARKSLPRAAATPAWESVREQLRHDRSARLLDAYQYTLDSPYALRWSALRRFAAPCFSAGRPLLTAVRELTGRIHDTFTYDAAATSVSTPLREVFRRRHGVCQDFAHLEIACLRSLGLAARYVSGYLVTQPPPGKPRLLGADASHAWVSVFCPGLGWVDVDPTNNVFPTDGHITVAIGRDYGDVSPVKGVLLGGGEHIVQVAVDVEPLHQPA